MDANKWADNLDGCAENGMFPSMDGMHAIASLLRRLQSDNKALLEACEAFDEADASDDGTGEAIGRVVSAKVLIKKAINQAKKGV